MDQPGLSVAAGQQFELERSAKVCSIQQSELVKRDSKAVNVVLDEIGTNLSVGSVVFCFELGGHVMRGPG